MAASAFQLAAWPKADRDRFLDEYRGLGFDAIRVFNMAPALSGTFRGAPGLFYPFVGTPQTTAFEDDPAHYAAQDDVIDGAAARGLIVELVLLADVKLAFSRGDFGTIEAYIRRVVDRYRSRPHVTFELINEHDTPGNELTPSQLDRLAAVVRAIDPDVLLSASRGGTPRPVDVPGLAASWLSYFDWHGPRDDLDAWPFAVWMLAAEREGEPAFTRRPFVNDEPMGSATPEEIAAYYGVIGMRDSRPEQHRYALWTTFMAGGYFTFHSHKGIRGEAGDTPGREAIAPFRQLTADVPFWTARSIDARRPPAATIVTGADGAAQAFALQGDRAVLVYLVRPSGSIAVRLHLPARATGGWFDPASAAPLAPLSVTAGASELRFASVAQDLLLRLTW